MLAIKEGVLRMKPILFISHITEEKDLALAFKDLVEKHFLGMLEVFVSSDEHSIGMGQRWLDNITNALKSCVVEIILCSPQSLKRPWINFEAGAGWIRDIPVIPLCHSGMEPSQLPMPLNLLQAAKAGEVGGLKLVFPVLANALGAQSPSIDFTEFTEYVKMFERRYTFWDSCNQAFTQLNQFDAHIIPRLKQGGAVVLPLSETNFEYLFKVISFLTEYDLVLIEKTGSASMSSSTGFSYQCVISGLPGLQSVLSDSAFKFRS
jgi:hypothetical protein